MDKTLSVKVNISALDRTLSFDRVVEDVIKPVAIRFKDKIESSIASLYPSLYWFTGTPGTIPATFLSLASAGAIMDDAAIPTDRFAIHSPDASANLADGLKGVYVQGKAKTAFEKAEVGQYGDVDNYRSVHTPTHVVGVASGTPRVNGATQNVTYSAAKDSWSQTLNTDGWTNSTSNILRAGDAIHAL